MRPLLFRALLPVLFTLFLPAFLFSGAEKDSALDVGIGGCFYGDAVGLTYNAAYSKTLSGWFGGSGTLSENLSLGGGISGDLVSQDLRLILINFEAVASYRFELSVGTIGLPVGFSPYFALGVPLTIVSISGNSATTAAVMGRLGGKFLYDFDSFSTGIGFEYKLSFIPGQAIGSMGLFAVFNTRI